MILFRDIIGHDDIVKNLKGAIVSGRVAHAYIFSGPEGVGKLTAAMAFARALVCSNNTSGDGCGQCSGCRKVSAGAHPDVHVIRPEGSTVKIAQIRQLTAGLQFGPATGRWTVRIIDGADKMTVEAANALLKTLEDPLPGVIIILVTGRPQAVVPTILSRCQHMYFQPLLKHQLIEGMIRFAEGPEEKMPLAASLAGGSLGRAVRLLSGGLLLRDRAADLTRRLTSAGLEEALTLAAGTAAGKEDVIFSLDLMVLWLRDLLVYNETKNPGRLINADRLSEVRDMAGNFTSGRVMEMIMDIESAKGSLAAGANILLALEVLFLRLAGKGPYVDRNKEVVFEKCL
jgi:DNA polymerase-3 subunit delta'